MVTTAGLDAHMWTLALQVLMQDRQYYVTQDWLFKGKILSLYKTAFSSCVNLGIQLEFSSLFLNSLLLGSL